MATASIDAIYTASAKLRDALDNWLAAVDMAAHEAAAQGLGVKPTRELGRALSRPSAELVELAGRPDGITPSEAVDVLAGHGLSANQNIGAERLRDLAQAGHIARLKLPGRRVRYFGSTEAALAWLARQQEADAAHPGLPELPEQPSAPRLVDSPQSARPSTAMDGVDIDAIHRKQPRQLADLMNDAAPAVAAALTVLAPSACAPRPVLPARVPAACADQPPPSPPKPAPYIPPTPSMARGERRQQLTDAAFVAPVSKPTGEAIVPPDVKRTVVNGPAFDQRFGVDPKAVGAEPESFSAQWKRLRGEGAEA